MSSTAEGVENEQQLASLLSDSCGEVQGFLIGRPMPACDVLPFLDRAWASDSKSRRSQLTHSRAFTRRLDLSICF